MADKKRLIDANALMEHLNRCIEQSKGLMKSVCVAIKCFVEQMPTVDAVEVVHARWEERYIHNGKYVAWYGFYCSACGNKAAKRHYCPNCGAKMDGGNEDD